MIVVKVELVSAVDPSRSQELGRMYIANDDTTGDPTRGDYTVGVCRKGETRAPWDGGKMTRTGEVKNYPRLAYNMWRLITRALLSAFPEERPGRKPADLDKVLKDVAESTKAVVEGRIVL